MQQTCRQCSSPFEITDEDLAFYEKVSPIFAGKKELIPPPTVCPLCRQKRRMVMRSERHLHRRSCDLCQKQFLSIYRAQTDFPVYCYDCWWSDTWDPLMYGCPHDPDKTFFEQLQSLAYTVPHLGIVFAHCENCDYTNFTNYSKNSYLMFGCHAADECLYGWRIHFSRQCIDTLQLDHCTGCYECVDCDDSYELFYSQDCTNCSSSALLYDCRSCSNCLGCVSLRNAEYHIFNQPVSPEEFHRQMALLTDRETRDALQEKFRAFLLSQPRRATVQLQSENVTGDHIIQGKNLRACFHIKNVEDGAFLESCEDLKDAEDCTFSGWPAELLYECVGTGVNSYRNIAVCVCWSCRNTYYSDSCHHAHDLFGCYGIHTSQRYCILNRQYGKEEYDALCLQIAEAMQRNGEWGEFFPFSYSPFGYNKTIGQEFFPMTKEEVLQMGMRWEEEEPLPESNAELQETLICEICQHPFRIIQKELTFYREHGIPLPLQCFSCRHTARMRLRNPSVLFGRECASCGKPIQTTYSPERSERIFCEECYLKQVY